MLAHGDIYNGQWQSDTMHGKGVMYYRDGSVYEGEWKDGEVSYTQTLGLDPCRNTLKLYIVSLLCVRRLFA